MARREGSALVWQKTDERLKKAVREAFEIAPLPNPPLELPDFPARPPSDVSKIIQQALGISSIDTAGFLFRLEQVIEKDEPDFIKRHIDRETEREKWLLKNLELIAEQIVILQIKDWFYSALDENSPDTDRWYLAVSIFIGLILRGSKITEAQCFPLFSSIIVAKQPDESTMKQISGPHHISWSGNKSDTFTEEVAHPSGVLAANSILDILQLHQTNHNTVLPYWLERLSISKHISFVLNIPSRVQNLIIDCNQNNCENLLMATIHNLSNNPDVSKEILYQACNSEKEYLRRNLASNLSRIDSEDRDFCVSLLEKLIRDEDSDTRVLSTTYLGNLARLERSVFIQFTKEISKKQDSRMIQRLIESGLRHYLSLDSNDSEDLVPMLWIRCNSEGRSQLSGMLVEIAKKNQPSLIKISSSIRLLDKESHIDLVNRITLRNSVLGNIIKNIQ